MGKRASKSQVDRLRPLHRKMLNNGITIERALLYDAKRWKEVFGGKKLLKKESLNAQKKLLKQLKVKYLPVLKNVFKREGITDPVFRKFILKRTKELLGLKKREQEIDVRINGSVHDEKKSFTITTYEELEKVLGELEGSKRNYSKHLDMIVYHESIGEMKRQFRVYYNFDYGRRIQI